MGFFLFEKSFYNFFTKIKYFKVRSMPAVPFKKLNLLFTNSGMNQFINFLNENRTPLPCFKNIVNGQPCIRLGGKFNDLSSIGLDHTHRTSFTMLGNWSLGGYSNNNNPVNLTAYLFSIWKIPVHRVHTTIFDPLNERFTKPPFKLLDFKVLFYIVQNANIFKLNALTQIHSKGKVDNFWQVGDVGPCGHSSELFFNSSIEDKNFILLELWNVVFVRFFKLKEDLKFLKKTYVDAGLGLERILGLYNTTKGYTSYNIKYSVYRDRKFIYFVSLFNDTYPINSKNLNYLFRLTYDHVNTIFILIKSGVSLESNGRGFILKKLIDRVIYFSKVLNLNYSSSKNIFIVFFIVYGGLLHWKSSVKLFLIYYYRRYKYVFNRNNFIKKEFTEADTGVLVNEVFRIHTTRGVSLKKIRLFIHKLGLVISWRSFLKISIY